MRKMFMAGAAALALACGTTVVSAQDAAAGAAPEAASADAAKPADPSWSAEYKAYYETLTAKQKEGWWALSDAQRKQVYDLPAEQRASVWASIESQLAGAAPQGAAAGAAGATAAPPAAAATDDTADAANPAGAAGPDAAAPADQVQANPRGEGPASATPPNPDTASSAVPPAQPADPSYSAGPYKGALTAPPAEAMNKEYPVCSRTVQDSCRNRGGV